jgi:putative CocE/NonD family hydrolase
MLASVWGTGSFAVNDFLGWSDMVAHQEDPRIRASIRQMRAPRLVARAAAKLPMGTAARALLGAGAPWFESWAEHCEPDDPFWDRMRHPAALDRAEVPVLLVGGWQDIFVQQTLQQYRHLRDRGVDVALTMGPWTHTELLTKGLAISVRETLDWLGVHLGGAPAQQRPSAVNVFVGGIKGQGWRNLPEWPPATTDRTLYLQPAGRLGDIAPEAGVAPATFRFDPADPTPTTGGPLMLPSGGYTNDSGLALRADVLDFTGATLTQDLYVYGNPVIELTHTSDNPHADLFVRVSEVDTNGRSRNVSDAYLRLSAAADPLAEMVSIELDGIAHRFMAGSRIRVLIAGGWFPRYARNLGTEEAVLTARQVKPATHSVHFGRSRLVLPVGPQIT